MIVFEEGGEHQVGEARQVALLNVFATPVLSASAVASVPFWASAASCLVCSVSVSICLRACSVESSKYAEGDCTPDNFWKKSKEALVFAWANSMNLLLKSCIPLTPIA